MLHRYKAWNAAMTTSAIQASVATGTSLKTMLQLSTPSTRQIMLLGWGYSFDDPPGADGAVDLIESDTAATVTAFSASGVQPVNPGSPASLLTLGVSNSGFTSSSETAPTTTRTFDAVSVSSTSAEAASAMRYEYFWLPGEGPVVAVSKFVRLRASFGTSGVDMRCWLLWSE